MNQAAAEVEIELEPSMTAIDAVFEKLLADIVRGVHPAGSRLPAERELSRQLGASRPTLREALRRLGEWNMIEPRRGSGVVVRPYRDWSIEVIGGYLRYGKPEGDQPSIAQILVDMLGLRRAIVLEVVRCTANRVPKGGTRQARLAMARAWSLRNDARFTREDFEVLRSIVEVAKFTPGLWMLNRVAEIYLDIAALMRFAIKVPDDYVATHTKFFDLLEAGEGNAACDLMAAYFERHDTSIAKLLAVVA
jgi:DNA-binding FadR family transcriptional regulator